MHSNISFLDVLFKVTLFSLITYKLYDLIKEYLVPFLKQQIAQEKKQRTELIEKEKLLNSTQQRFKNQIYNQKQMFILLEKNVHEWHKWQLSENIRIEKELASTIEKTQLKRTVQNNNLVLLNHVQLGMPAAIEQALCELKTKYSNSAGKDLLTNVIEQLPQDASSH
jgi:hypothetical protein